MFEINFRIEARAPLLFPAYESDPNMVSSVHFIPGSVLLGYYASNYIRINNLPREKAHEDHDFNLLFLRNGVTFSNALVARAKEDGLMQLFQAAPLSLMTDKADETTIKDLLTEQDDSFQGKPLHNFVSSDFNYRHHVDTVMHFHHERDRTTGATKSGVIFNYEAINMGQIFCGKIIGSSENLQKCKNLFVNGKIYLGRSKSAQYGEACIYFEEITPFKSGFSVSEPAEATMTFLSDAIILNDCGFSTLDHKALEHILGVRIIKSFVKAVKIESFVGAWSARRPEETAYAAGSCFILEKIPEKFTEFESVGIGERRGEGFGRVKFGWQNSDLQMVCKQVGKEPCINWAKSPLPELTRKILRNVLESKMHELATIEGMRAAASFMQKTGITNSLASRLLGFINSSADYTAFRQKLEHLKDTARRKLESCHNGKLTLFDFLKKTDHASDIDFSNLNEIMRLVGFNHDEISKRKAFKAYYQAFFVLLRKKEKRA